MPSKISLPNHQSGLSLIEVLVAIVVISFGLLGVASMQITGIKNNQSAYYRSTATFLGYDMLDRMRANKKALIAGSYDTGGSFVNGKLTPGSASAMVDIDKEEWLTALGNQLPSSKAKIEAAAGASTLRVTIQWNDARGTGGGTTQSLSVETQGCAIGESCVF
ncbi:MAG: type IV pilus modification protein PilV [Betaproteobacteria bacterium HGW-Betaproteobacteria-7]|jgi:type IV pilus assembly protein PilV|nr:MAG: type IV pilus modification protein PilV [Betaproteobacteria bacterium HGW-Betaproteobacteria-7]